MLDKNKKEMIDKIVGALRSEAIFIRTDTDLSPEDKVAKMDVLLDVHHFLKDYEKNIKILNEYNAQHRFDKENRGIEK